MAANSVLQLEVGCRVRIHSLQTKPHLNGAEGIVSAELKGRWRVEVAAKALSLKPSCLTVVAAAPTAPHVSTDGHFNIPEGTTSIVSRPHYQSEGECSWEIWLLDPKEVKTVTIPDSVTTIGMWAFSGCSSLTSITIPDSVTVIGTSAFNGCCSLASIAIPDSVTAIGERAFDGCGLLPQTHFNVPGGTTSIVQDWWDAWKVLKATVCSITIPKSVTVIGESAFSGCTSLVSITIPDSVTTIGEQAFWACSSLASIAIPDSVTTIGESAFNNCYSLASITIPDSVTTIGEMAFEYCTSLVSIAIPDSVTTIGDEAFYGCSSLVSIAIPDSVTTIGNDTFAVCSSLASVAIPDSVTTIGNSSFHRCTLLASISIPDSVTAIGSHAFGECSSLASIAIPDSVTTIGECAFLQCTSLASITIGNSVTTIGERAFYECTSLASITIPDSVATIDPGAFEACILLAMVLVKPAATANNGLVDANLWNKVFEVPVEGDFMFDYGAENQGKDQVVPFQHVTRIWTPDAIVDQLTGPFAEYSTFASIPRIMRAAPDATTWAAVELWMWWSPPTRAGYTNRVGVCNDDRIVCKTRHATLLAATMAGFEVAKAADLPPLPPLIWLLVFGFLKHDEPPAYC